MEIYEKKNTISSKMLRLVAEIDEFKGSWMALGQLSPDRLISLKRVATIESVASSTRIEGVKLSDAEVEALLGNVNISSFKSRDEEEVAGYSALMNLIFISYQELHPNENIIKQLHQELLKFSHKDIRQRGEYKKVNNNVEALDQNGSSLGIVFETSSPMATPMRMSALCEWLESHVQDSVEHPLILIGKFIVDFLAIHPFQDGNGRLSRALTTLLLMRSNYDYAPYSSLERIIEQNKEKYYLCLRAAQTEKKESTKGLESWLEFFLECLKNQKDVLLHKLEKEKALFSLPRLSEQIIHTLKDHGKLSLSDIVKIIGANRNTVKSHLSKLVANGQIRREGIGKGTNYKI